MPASEIDDIFAKKGKVQLASAPSIEHPEKKKKKKKKKKSDNAADAEEEQQRESPKSTTSKKRPAPETIIDESSLPIKKAKTTKLSGKKTGKDNQFFDSRGTGSRKYLQDIDHPCSPPRSREKDRRRLGRL
jgi:hypothetical protein